MIVHLPKHCKHNKNDAKAEHLIEHRASETEITLKDTKKICFEIIITIFY